MWWIGADQHRNRDVRGNALAKRNLLEISMMCFVICIASELRARDVAAKDISSLMKKAA